MGAVVIDQWHKMSKTKDVTGLDDILADDAVFHSPVVHTPQVGKALTKKYLAAAFASLFNDSFEYVREIVGERDAMLEFVVEIDGIHINGIDIITWNENDKIVDFKVLVRPLKAISVVAEHMVQALKAGS